MRYNMMNKRGQVAIFVIIALVLVGGIIAYFAIRNLPKVSEQAVLNPKSAIEKCTQDAVNEVVEKMLAGGGFVKPSSFKTYNGTVAYMCVNDGYFRPCVNQHPMLLNEMKTEIKNYITPTVEGCFASMKQDAESKGYNVQLGVMTIDISLAPNRIFVDIARSTVLRKNENVQTSDAYKVEIVNPLYDLANVAVEIANQEAKYCNFENVGYSVLYPQFDIQKWMMSDSTKIYTIKDKPSGKTMRIATRSCALPLGLI
jgi:hypothetical protein